MGVTGKGAGKGAAADTTDRAPTPRSSHSPGPATPASPRAAPLAPQPGTGARLRFQRGPSRCPPTGSPRLTAPSRLAGRRPDPPCLQRAAPPAPQRSSRGSYPAPANPLPGARLGAVAVQGVEGRAGPGPARPAVTGEAGGGAASPGRLSERGRAVPEGRLRPGLRGDPTADGPRGLPRATRPSRQPQPYAIGKSEGEGWRECLSGYCMVAVASGSKAKTRARIQYYSEKYDVTLLMACFARPAFRLGYFFSKGEWTVLRECVVDLFKGAFNCVSLWMQRYTIYSWDGRRAMPGAGKMKDAFTRLPVPGSGGQGGCDSQAPGLLPAHLPGKWQASLQAAWTAFEAFLHPPHFFKGTMTGPDAPQSPEAELLRLQETPVCIK